MISTRISFDLGDKNDQIVDANKMWLFIGCQ